MSKIDPRGPSPCSQECRMWQLLMCGSWVGITSLFSTSKEQSYTMKSDRHSGKGVTGQVGFCYRRDPWNSEAVLQSTEISSFSFLQKNIFFFYLFFLTSSILKNGSKYSQPEEHLDLSNHNTFSFDSCKSRQKVKEGVEYKPRLRQANFPGDCAE